MSELSAAASTSTTSSRTSSISPSPSARRPPPKRLVFFCDGTSRDGFSGETGRDTNVYRMYRIIENAEASRAPNDIKQVLLWQPGVGMEPSDGTFWQSVFAVNLNVKIRRAYDMLRSNYSPGDDIVFIGFSRGAFVVRILAAVLGDVGFTPNGEDEVDTLFDAYAELPQWEDAKKVRKPTVKVKNALRVLEGFRKRVSATVVISALCIFDTVGTIGFQIPHTHRSESRYFGFPVELVGPHVNYIYHALALDDTRRPFFPTRVELGPKKNGQTLEQCYFGGWHADVGGGWDDHELACISLAWMAAHLQEHNLVHFDETSLLQIPGTYLDARKSKPKEESVEETMLEQAWHSLTRVLPPTRPWGEGMTWPELFPFVKWIPVWNRPPMKDGDSIHISAYSPVQVLARKKRNPKLQEAMQLLPCSQLLPLEVRARQCWPGSDEVVTIREK